MIKNETMGQLIEQRGRMSHKKHIKKNIHRDQEILLQGKVSSQSINIIMNIYRISDKKMIILIDAQKVYDKIKYPCMTKVMKKLGIGRTFLNIVKCTYDKSTAHIVLNGKNHWIYIFQNKE
jgi:hypothetical protein